MKPTPLLSFTINTKTVKFGRQYYLRQLYQTAVPDGVVLDSVVLARLASVRTYRVRSARLFPRSAQTAHLLASQTLIFYLLE